MSSDGMIPEEARPDRFKKHLLEEGYAASTARSYARSVEKLISWMEAEGLGPAELGYSDLVAWTRQLKAEGAGDSPDNSDSSAGGYASSCGYARKTVNGYLRAARHWIDWLASKGVRDGNPARGLKVRGERKQVPGNLLDEDQLTDLYENHPRETLSERRDRVITGLVAFQALRKGELEALRPENVDLEAGTAHVPEKGRGKARKLQLRTEQIAPLMSYLKTVRPQLVEATLKAGGDEPDALLTSTGRSTDLGNVLQLWIGRLREQNPKVKNARQLRASRIVRWIRASGLRKAQQKAGHAHISSTERYREADLEGLKASVERHHPLK